MPERTTAGRFMRLFEGNMGASGTHGEPDWEPEKLKWAIKRTALTLREPVTEALWEQHLAGTRPLGVVPVRDDSTCYWGSVDYDEYDADLQAVIARVVQFKLPLVPCRSKSGGLHLWLFMRQPTQAEQVIVLLRELAARVGVAGSEIFPKQATVLAERGDVGNWIVMPYFGGSFGDKLQAQVGLTPEGDELTAEQFLDLAESMRLSAEEFEELASRRPRSRRGNGANGAAHVAPSLTGTAFSDGPPCLQHLAATGVQPGGQNNALLMMGVYYKKKDPENWKALLEEANNTHLRPPGTHEGLQQVLSSLEKKDYEYTCKKEPMASHCDSPLCMTRKHGVGAGANFPRIGGISKLNTEPPIWFVDIDDQRLEVTTDELQNYMRFHKVCLDRLNRSYGLLKQGTWMQTLADAMRNLFIIDAPPDVGTPAQFAELLAEFLTNRAQGTSREDLLTGRPWEDEDEQRHYFRMQDLMKFLQREGMKDVTRVRVARRLEALGGGHRFLNIRGHGTNLWHVPSDVAPRLPEPTGPSTRSTPI